MEEKKKRVRPTWAMVRALEAQVKTLQAKLDDQIDGTSMLVQDCDGWRDKYHVLLAERDFYKRAAEMLSEENGVSKSDDVSVQYNDIDEENLKRKISFGVPDKEYIRNFFDELGAITDSVGEMGGVSYVDKSPEEDKKRGFWSRIFKRK